MVTNVEPKTSVSCKVNCKLEKNIGEVGHCLRQVVAH